MSLNRILPALLISMLCVLSSAAAQQVCTLKAENAPELRGLRLGMSLNQVTTQFPKARVHSGKFGHARVELYGSVLKETDPGRFSGVSQVILEFVDERATSLAVFYDDSVKWQSIAQFADVVSKALGLPAAWDNNNRGRMTCDGFQIFVNTNHISLHNPGAYEVVRQRELQEEDKKRQSFRP